MVYRAFILFLVDTSDSYYIRSTPHSQQRRAACGKDSKSCIYLIYGQESHIIFQALSSHLKYYLSLLSVKALIQINKSYLSVDKFQEKFFSSFIKHLFVISFGLLEIIFCFFGHIGDYVN